MNLKVNILIIVFASSILQISYSLKLRSLTVLENSNMQMLDDQKVNFDHHLQVEQLGSQSENIPKGSLFY